MSHPVITILSTKIRASRFYTRVSPATIAISSNSNQKCGIIAENDRSSRKCESVQGVKPRGIEDMDVASRTATTLIEEKQR
jgi:hypothetical protein